MGSGACGYTFPKAAVDIGYRRMLNLSNATDRNGFIIKLGMSSWPFKRETSQIGLSSLPVLATLGVLGTCQIGLVVIH